MSTPRTASVIDRVKRKRQEHIASEHALRIVHSAWMEVSGDPSPEEDAVSAKLGRIKKYLLSH